MFATNGEILLVILTNSIQNVLDLEILFKDLQPTKLEIGKYLNTWIFHL